MWLTPLRDLQCPLDTLLAGLAMHTYTHTHICTCSVSQISEFLGASNFGLHFSFWQGQVSLEGHQTGASGHTRLLSFSYQMLSGYLPGAKNRDLMGPVIPATGLRGHLGPRSGDLYRVTC